MRIAVLGTGMVGRTVGGKLAELGHEVVLGTRDAAATLARSEPDRMGNPPVSAWLASNSRVRLVAFADTGSADLFVNATSGVVSLDVLSLVGAENLTGKVVMDIANPLDFSRGMPPTLTIKDTDSLGELLQRSFPQAYIVKALNTLNAALMVNPQLVGAGATSVFICGNEQAAKQVVVDLLTSFGWQDIIDLGDITAARGTEMLLPLWLRLMMTFGTPTFNFQIVR